MDRLTLPDPARALWKEAAPELHRLLELLPEKTEQFRIGGGTVLASRWRHRKSSDMDLTVPESSGMELMNQAHSETIRTRFTAIGANRPMLTDSRYRIEFPNGTVDLAASDPRPRLGGRRVECHGYAVEAMSTIQILRGKLERSLKQEPPARDLFDVVVARQMDRKALAGAVNMLSEEEQREVLGRWQNADYRVQREAAEAIHVIRPEHERLLRNLCERAVRILEDSKYIESTVTKTLKSTVVETRSRLGTERTDVRKASLDETLEKTGLTAYFTRTLPGPAAVLERIHKTLSGPESEPTTLTTTSVPAPERRRTESRQSEHRTGRDRSGR